MIKRFFYAFAAVMTVVLLGSCGSKSSNSDSSASADSTAIINADSIIIIYYSQTGNTEKLAQALQKELGSNIVEIEPVVPYDGTYEETIKRWKNERDSDITVEIKPLDINLDDYNTIFLAFPIWGGTYALPVKTFLEQNSFDGKKIVTFATFGSGGLENATEELAAMHPEAQVFKGYGIREARIGKAFTELNDYLIENNYKEGVLETLGDYSEPEVCNQEAIEIFEKACSDYKYPLGTPVKVGSRETKNSIDYKFEVEQDGPEGSKGTATIYVKVDKAEGAVPEFTNVVRH